MQFDRLSRCSNKRNYEYNQQDIKKIFNAIEKRVKETKDMFLQEGGGEKEFSL
jgi:hypothetical protein